MSRKYFSTSIDSCLIIALKRKAIDKGLRLNDLVEYGICLALDDLESDYVITSDTILRQVSSRVSGYSDK